MIGRESEEQFNENSNVLVDSDDYVKDYEIMQKM